MPGTDLDLDLPVPGDAFSVIVAKLTQAVQTIQADLEPRIGAGSLDIDTELSMGGAPLTNVGGIRIQNGESTVVGTLYMDEELYIVTQSGAVRITNQGVLDVTALGVIGGDYGGSNPAEVTFNDTAAEYRFKENATDWADIAVRDIILKGSAGTFRLGVDSGLSGDQEIRFKSVPVTGYGLFAFNSADNSLVNAVGVSPVVGGMTFTADIDIGNHKITHGDMEIQGTFSAFTAVSQTGSVSSNGSNPGVVQSTGKTYYPVTGTIPSNARIKSLVVGFVDTAYANVSVGYQLQQAPGSTGWTGGDATVVASASTTLTLTLSVPQVFVANQPVWILVDNSTGITCKPKSWKLTYDVIP